MIHLHQRKASKEFAPLLQSEPHVMTLWRRAYVIHYFCLHKENLVYDVASDIGGVSPDWRQVLLASAVPAEPYSGWGAFARQQCPHTKFFFFYDRREQEPRCCVDSFSAPRGFTSSHLIGRFVNLKDKMEDKVDFHWIGLFIGAVLAQTVINRVRLDSSILATWVFLFSSWVSEPFILGVND